LFNSDCAFVDGAAVVLFTMKPSIEKANSIIHHFTTPNIFNLYFLFIVLKIMQKCKNKNVKKTRFLFN